MKKKDSVRTVLYAVLILFPTTIVVWIFIVYFFGCGGLTNSCNNVNQNGLTPVPTLIPATMPIPQVGAGHQAAPAKCQVAAVDLIGDWVKAGVPETAPFDFTDSKGTACTATFSNDVQPLFTTPNLWYDGASACTTCHTSDLATASANMSLGTYQDILAGAGRTSANSKGTDILGGGNWEKSILYDMLYVKKAMPLGRPPSVPASGPTIFAGTPKSGASASGSSSQAAPTSGASSGSASQATPTTATTEAGNDASQDIARPSNGGGAGLALTLFGNADSGKQIYDSNCASCHGSNGQGGVPNAGSTDETVPALNPIDPTIQNSNFTTFAYNLDLFIEHGSKPEGSNPALQMPAWGDSGKLQPQQIADVIAYITGLNGVKAPAATPAASNTSNVQDIARPSNAGGAGIAISLTGDVSAGQKVYASVCQTCHGPNAQGGVQNPGSEDGTVPPLNPIDPTIKSDNPVAFAYNIDLFVEHGSTPEGPSPQLRMPPWGDEGQLQPQQIADVIAYIMSLNSGAPATPLATPNPDIARPTNSGGAGVAVTLYGNADSGKQLYDANCASCHGSNGQGGVQNPGSADGTVPSLNPIDPTIKSTTFTTFAYNIDLFMEHGSTPEGTNPTLLMPAWGDGGKLQPQQIADIIAYLTGLNGVQAPTPPAGASSSSGQEIARPSNSGGAGIALTLTGNVAAGKQTFDTVCASCHGSDGKGGVQNPGSTDGTVPPLNPIDPTIKNPNPFIFGYNLDLFLEHGSTPDGPSPQLQMPPWGDKGQLQPQQIADVIAYIISLNP